jgi:hypothetical protein
VKARFDLDHDISYGYYECPKCGIAFYGPDVVFHEPDCSDNGFENCTYVFGPNEDVASFTPVALRDLVSDMLKAAQKQEPQQ